MAREPINTWFFVLVVVRKEDRFLLIQERKHGQLWYLPAGRVEPGETFIRAAVRETLEESGVPVTINGIIRLEHTPMGSDARMRVIFSARPEDDTPPISEPNDDALQARWVTLDDLKKLPLRGLEVASLFKYVAGGGPIYPLSLLAFEGESYKF